MKLRKYRAFWDDGHDTGEFEYYSSHRNYSKGNMEDMKREYKKNMVIVNISARSLILVIY